MINQPSPLPACRKARPMRLFGMPKDGDSSFRDMLGNSSGKAQLCFLIIAGFQNPLGEIYKNNAPVAISSRSITSLSCLLSYECIWYRITKKNGWFIETCDRPKSSFVLLVSGRGPGLEVQCTVGERRWQWRCRSHGSGGLDSVAKSAAFAVETSCSQKNLLRYIRI